MSEPGNSRMFISFPTALMPNHVSNTVTISGDPEMIELLGKAVTSDEIPFDFERIIPKPPIVTHVSSDFISSATMQSHPKRNAYDWQVANWGTKWNAYDFTESGPTRFSFLTAWSPPLPVIETLSDLFPELDVTIEFQDEFDYESQILTFRNGVLIVS